jgi:hypothetical protein
MYELIYTSGARRLFDPGQLAALLATARTNNARQEVSGILLYDAGSFFQVLEGEASVVRPLFERIARDERHYRVQVLREGAVSARSFAEWSMGYVSLDAQLRSLLAKRHGLSSNGSMIEDASSVLPLLDAFRNGQLRTYIFS